MEFPVRIRFRSLMFELQISLTDADDRCIGYVRQSFGRLASVVRIFADGRMDRHIYTLRSGQPDGYLCSFTDALGRQVGRIAYGEKIDTLYLSVGDEVRFRIEDETPWLTFVDALLPTVPVFNVVLGVFSRPKQLVLRAAGDEPVLRAVKARTMLEADYCLYQLGKLDGDEVECVMLGMMIAVFRQRRLST